MEDPVLVGLFTAPGWRAEKMAVDLDGGLNSGPASHCQAEHEPHNGDPTACTMRSDPGEYKAERGEKKRRDRHIEKNH